MGWQQVTDIYLAAEAQESLSCSVEWAFEAKSVYDEVWVYRDDNRTAPDRMYTACAGIKDGEIIDYMERNGRHIISKAGMRCEEPRRPEALREIQMRFRDAEEIEPFPMESYRTYKEPFPMESYRAYKASQSDIRFITENMDRHSREILQEWDRLRDLGNAARGAVRGAVQGARQGWRQRGVQQRAADEVGARYPGGYHAPGGAEDWDDTLLDQIVIELTDGTSISGEDLEAAFHGGAAPEGGGMRQWMDRIRDESISASELAQQYVAYLAVEILQIFEQHRDRVVEYGVEPAEDQPVLQELAAQADPAYSHQARGLRVPAMYMVQQALKTQERDWHQLRMRQ